MDLHYLEIFNTIAKYESYKKASDILHISQPALSVQIKRLEDQIGLKLFNKIGNHVQLSENGIMLQEYTQRIFNIVDELNENISDQKNFIGGTLNIGGSNTPGTYILPEVIGAFKKEYPGIKINLHIGNTAEISHLINNGTLDIAVNGGSCAYGSCIYVEQLFEDRLILAASLQNELLKATTVTKEDLSGMSFVVHKTDSQLFTYYQKFIEEIDIPENISMYLGNIDAIKRAVESNLGISLIPYVAVKFELQYGIIKELKISDHEFNYSYSLIYNKNKSLSATSNKFTEFLRAYMSTNKIT